MLGVVGRWGTGKERESERGREREASKLQANAELDSLEQICKARPQGKAPDGLSTKPGPGSGRVLLASYHSDLLLLGMPGTPKAPFRIPRLLPSDIRCPSADYFQILSVQQVAPNEPQSLIVHVWTTLLSGVYSPEANGTEARFKGSGRLVV